MGLVVRADAESAAPFSTDSTSASSNGAQAAERPRAPVRRRRSLLPPLPSGDLVYEQRNAGQRAATSFRLIFALPWRRFKKGSVLQLDVRTLVPACRAKRPYPLLLRNISSRIRSSQV